MSNHGDMYDDLEGYGSQCDRMLRKARWQGFWIGMAVASVAAAAIVHFTLGWRC